MKKIIFTICFLLLMIQTTALADEIVDSQGNIIPCKIETISGGLIEYKKDGNLYYFERVNNQPIFNDYVDVRVKFFKEEVVERYTGKVLLRDSYGIRIRTEAQDIVIPWYRVKFIGIYKP